MPHIHGIHACRADRSHAEIGVFVTATKLWVTNQKPAPDIFIEAARRIGVDPKFCRGYEDTDLGMTAIRSAGMDAVDVRTLIKATA